MNQPTDKPLRRITFGIVSHPDAGKTTLTEKLLLFSGVIQLAGTIKGRKSKIHTTSDWMELEKERGISVSTSVMQFTYRDHVINLLDTPGHADFSEDTYRTLTAVDAVLMVLDAAKGVEARTIKLLEVCRLRNIPIVTFINKMDRNAMEPIDLLDDVERQLNITCSPTTWPIGMGKDFKGVYHLREDRIYLFEPGKGESIQDFKTIDGLDSPELTTYLADQAPLLHDEISLVKGTMHGFNYDAFMQGQLTPVFFGSALNNFGVKVLLNDFIDYAPEIQARQSETRRVEPDEKKFTGFIFKIQANMDPSHRDRIAFLRICSGQYQKGMTLYHVRTKRNMKINKALTFIASEREQSEEAFAGDIIGLHNHGTIQIGDTFTEGEELKFTGIPHFAPELLKRVLLKEPIKQKKLLKGISQLSEEGATQAFYPLSNNDLLLGAVGALQFEVVAYRLKHEYDVECVYEPVSSISALWVVSDDPKQLEDFKKTRYSDLALDNSGDLVYLLPDHVYLKINKDRWPAVRFVNIKEH